MKDLQTIATEVTRFGTHSLIDQGCPSCGTFPLRGFYAVRGVPVQSGALAQNRDEALNCLRGDVHLAYCWKCGFITNVSFDAEAASVVARCDLPPEFSETYRQFQSKLATYLLDNFDLHRKQIVEINCSRSEFLPQLCEEGNNLGIGFDPGTIPTSRPTLKKGKVEYIQDSFSDKYAPIEADFYICRMTLEHTKDVKEYVSMIRRAVGNRQDAAVFFQVPEVFRILRELAFWDIYYENCSYFSAGSLGRLFRACGFDILDLWTDFDGRYLMIEARPGVSGPLMPPLPQENDLQQLLPLAGYFSQAIKQKVNNWRTRLQDYNRSGLHVVLWGGGSKASAFLSVLGLGEEIRYIVDINPGRQYAYIAGTGQQIIPPAFLQEYHPDVVIVMNPAYNEEIRKMLIELGLSPDLIPINV